MGKRDKKRSKSGRTKTVTHPIKPKVITTSTITLLELFMDIMRPPRTVVAPDIEQTQRGPSDSAPREMAGCQQ